MGYTVAAPCPVFLDEGADLAGTTGRLLGAGFSRSRPLGVGFWNSAVYGQPAIPPAGHQKAALRLDALRGAASPDVLKGSGTRVSLPVAHYSDMFLLCCHFNIN